MGMKISDEQFQSMMNMMNPQMMKQAQQMMKNNPDIVNQARQMAQSG